MKKTLNINLNGRVFNIDEDAYELLANYLDNLKSYFRKEQDSAEIIRDFEARIEELFLERIRLGYNVITIEQVETIIQRMGKPEDFGNEGFEPEEASATDNTKKSSAVEEKPKKRFYRNVDDKIIAGVCSGIAAYFGWDTLPVRIIFFILIFASQFFFVLVYLLLWILMPAAQTATQKLEMRGEAVTLENIGKTVSETIAATNNNSNGFFSAVLKLGTGCLGCLVGLPLAFALFIVFIVLFALLIGGITGNLFIPLHFLGLDWGIVSVVHPVVGTIAFILLLGIPLFFIIYALFAAISKTKPLNKIIKWLCLIVWIIALIVVIFSGFGIVSKNNSCKFRVGKHITCNANKEGITGSGQMADRTDTLPLFSRLKINDELIGTIRIKQGEESQILINGDENLIDKIEWRINDNGELKLGVQDHINLCSLSNLIIVITTPKITEVDISSIAKIFIDNKIESSDFKINLKGAGSFSADSLYTKNLICNLEGIGKINLGGKTNQANLRLEGAGKIDASALEADSLVARLQGIGAIRCNPVSFLDATLKGIGKISYKNKPKSVQSFVDGIGKLGEE